MKARTPVISPEAAAHLVENGDTVLIGGSGGGLATPEAVLEAIGARYEQHGTPTGLTAIHPVGCGDWGKKGASHLAKQGLLMRQIAGSLSNSAETMAMAKAGDIEAYTLPQGVISQLCRDVAGGRPGILTHIGLDTFVDPRFGGGRQSPAASEDIVRRIEIDGTEYLYFPAFHVDIALIRATTADEDGNLTMEREAFVGEMLAMAQAAHNCGGIVIAQVERQCAVGTLSSREVRVPGFLVDAVVVDPDQWQTYAVRYNPGYSGEQRLPARSYGGEKLDIRKLVARRASLELVPGTVANLGFGIANGISDVLDEEGVADDVVLTVEQGLVGGVPARGNDAGAGVNFTAMLEQPSQFDFYDGGGLDMAFLSFAEVDRFANVNVSRFAGRPNGPGGFINISQNAKAVRYMGTFTSGGLDITLSESGLQIEREGRHARFVEALEQRTFDAGRAIDAGHSIRVITERGVFDVDTDGMILTEAAPGIDIERDIIDRLPWPIRVSPELTSMPQELFVDRPMGLRARFDRIGPRAPHSRLLKLREALGCDGRP